MNMVTIMIRVQFIYIKERPKTYMQKCIVNVTISLKYARIPPNSLKNGQTVDKLCIKTCKICKVNSYCLFYLPKT